jgi:ketosteroid isomerase-like protein
MDYGSREMGNHDNIRKGYAEMTEALIRKGVFVTSRIVPEGTHSEASWERQLPFMIETLLYGQEE